MQGSARHVAGLFCVSSKRFFQPWGGPDNDEIEKVFADEDVADQQVTLVPALVANRFRRKLVDLRGWPHRMMRLALGAAKAEQTLQEFKKDFEAFEFFREKRIGHQVRLARDARMRKQWDRVLESTDGLAALFDGVDVKPSVLHGDLWSGNMAAVGGQPRKGVAARKKSP